MADSCAKKTVENFYRALLEEKNVEHALSFLDEQVHIIGSSQGDVASGTDEAKTLLQTALIREDAHYLLGTQTLSVQTLPENTLLVQGIIQICMESPGFPSRALELCVTAACQKRGTDCKIRSLHVSIAWTADGRLRDFPIQLAQGRRDAFEREIYAKTADLLGKSILGGILGVYLGETWPLYYINDRLLAHLGYHYEEFYALYGADIRKLLHPHDREAVARATNDAKVGCEHTLKYRIQKQDGNYLWVKDISKKEYFPDGRLVCLSAVSDMTHELETTQRLYSEIVQKETQTRLYNELFQSVLCGIVQYRLLDDAHFVFENANQEAIRIFGYDTDSFWKESVWPISRISSPDDFGGMLPSAAQVENKGGKRDYEYRLQQKNGEYCWIIGNVEIVTCDEKGLLIQTVFLDIDKSKRAEIRNQMLSEQVAAGNLLLRMALEHTTTCEFYYYPNERIGIFPPRTARQYRCNERYTGMPESFAAQMVDDAWRGTYDQMFSHIHDGRESGCAEFKARDGMSWCRITMSTVSRTESGEPSLVVGIIEDSTMAKEMELALEDAHTRDELTGLYTRDAGLRKIKEFMRQKSPEQICGMMLLDMDDFAALNREEGHVFANAILQDVANILKAETAADDILVRLGGDEFMLFLKNCNKARATVFGPRIAEKIKSLFLVRREVAVSASIGMCVTEVVDEYEGLYRCAESTLHYVKANGKGKACCYLDVSNEVGTMLTQLYTGSYFFNEIEEKFGYQESNLVSFALDLLGKAKKLDDAVSLLLARIGKYYHLDRVMVLEFSQEYLSLHCTYQWVSSWNSSRLGQMFYVRREQLPSIIRLYDEDGTSKAIQNPRDVMPSCLHIALWNQGAFAGLLCLECKREDFAWSPDGKKTVKELAKIIASHILQARADLGSRAKTEFLSRMSHEIRTPMNAIAGMTAIAKASIDHREKTLECLGKIEYANTYLLSLINDILDMARIESGKMEAKYDDADLGDLFDKLHFLLLPQAQAKNIIFSLCNAYRENRLVKVDALRLNQVMVNIIGNAIKFTDTNGKVTVYVTPVSSGERTVQLRFSVEDTGIGIAKEQMHRIFHAFEQANQDTIHKYGGTGLGLSISSRLVQMMGGTLKVKSVLGEGSEFYFTLTLEYATSTAISEALPLPQQDNADSTLPPGVSWRLLVAEDNDLNREIAGTLLQMKGFTVEEACHGGEALQKYLDNPPSYYDAILMDIRMPVMDGLEATRKIRTSGKSDARMVPIIAMTANAFDEDSQKSMAHGMNGHLIKPLVMEQLIALLKSCIYARNAQTADEGGFYAEESEIKSR